MLKSLAVLALAAALADLPKPPLDLPAPKAPPRPTTQGKPVTDPGELQQRAQAAAEKKNYKFAVAAQHLAVQKGADGRYNLACYYSLAGDKDGAFYWLQQAALTEGADPDHARTDDDLKPLHADPRYKQVDEFLKKAVEYWRENAKPVTLVYVPKGHDKAKPTAVLLCLHGRGSSPQQFFGDQSQELADELKMPVVCVSGPKAAGPKSFVWAVEAAADAKRLDDALASAKDKLTAAPGQRIALGFSEGAQVAIEVAARNPGQYAGAIALSPGAEPKLAGLKPDAALKGKRFVVSVGSAEAPGNIQLANLDRTWLTKAGAQVTFQRVPQGGHSLPPDFGDRLPEWVKAILDAGK